MEWYEQTAYQHCKVCKYVQRQSDGTYACAIGCGFIASNREEVISKYGTVCGGYSFEHWAKELGIEHAEELNHLV